MQEKRLTRLLCLLVFGVSACTAEAQFSIEPTDSLVTSFVTDSVPRIFQIDFPNQTQDSLGITWRRVGGGWTEGWDVNLCDLGECYTGVPSDADMMPMPPGGSGFLKLIVNAFDIEGECVLHFWVWPSGNQDALVNVYFDLRNGAVSAVAEREAQPMPRAWPNPIQSGATLSVDWPRLDLDFSPSTVQRLGPDGRFTPCTPSVTPKGWDLSTDGWPSGLHWIFRSDSQTPIRVIVH